MSLAAFLLFAAPGLPLALCAAMLAPRLRDTAFALLPFAALPALAAALLVPDGTVESFPRILLGAGLALDGTGRVFLGVAALLWTLAGLHARATIREKRHRFAGFWLATLAGNMMLFAAADLVSFYLAFALLSLAAFGLVVHTGSGEARRAGRVYLALAVLGETCLLLGFMLAAAAGGSILIAEVRPALAEAPARDLALGLMVAGFGLKAGMVPLHVWLPLAHPAAPVPASAVLSGAIVKAGIFGLVTFLPLDAGLPGWSGALVALGLLTCFAGIAFGLGQKRPKTVLAYSTISQMGILVTLLGAALSGPGAGFAVAAAALYAAHHGLAKGALFLSVSVHGAASPARRPAVLAVAALAGLAIAGLPFTGGALAKLAIKGPLGDGMASLLVTLSAVGTTLLMLRFLRLLKVSEPAGTPATAGTFAFLGTAAAALVLPWVLFPRLSDLAVSYAFSPANLWGAGWPLLLAAALLAGWTRLPRRPPFAVPEGDMLVPVLAAGRWIARVVRGRPFLRAGFRRPAGLGRMGEMLDNGEAALARWPVAGTGLVLLIAVLFIL